MANITWEHVPSQWRPFLELSVERFRLQARSTNLQLSGLHGFVGVSQMSKSYKKLNMAMVSCDLVNDPVLQNCLLMEGQQYYLEKLAQLSLKPDGLCWLDPPCAFWVWVSSSVHKRSTQNPHGDCSHPGVEWNNAIADFVADVMLTCSAMSIHYVLEQPLSSRLPDYPAVERALMSTGGRRIVVPLWKFGSPSIKPLQLWGTAPWLQQLARIADRIAARPSGSEPEDYPPTAERVFVEGPQRQLAVVCTNGQVTGLHHEMKASAHYPGSFCDVVALLHHSHLTREFVRAVVKILARRVPSLREAWFSFALLPFLLVPNR